MGRWGNAAKPCFLLFFALFAFFVGSASVYGEPISPAPPAAGQSLGNPNSASSISKPAPPTFTAADPQASAHPPSVHTPKVAEPPKLKLMEIMKVLQEPARPRPVLFKTTPELLHRSLPIAATKGPGTTVDEVALALETHIRESTNDLAAAEAEYKADLLKVEINALIHAPLEKLLADKIIPPQTAEESLTKLRKSQWKAEENRHRCTEFEAEVALDSRKLARHRGEAVTLLDIANTYVDLWESRVAKTEAAEKGARADFEYLDAAFERAKELRAKGAKSEADKLLAQRDRDEAELVWSLAKKLVDQNKVSLEQAINNAAKAKIAELPKKEGAAKRGIVES